MDKQLTLFGQFEASTKRQSTLYKELVRSLRDLKYIQGHINAFNESIDPTPKPSPILNIMNSARGSIDYSAYYLAHLLYGVSRELSDHKDKAVDHYLAKAVFDPYAMPSDRLLLPQVYKCMLETQSRLKRLILPYKQDLEKTNTTAQTYKFLISSLEGCKDTLEMATNIHKDEKNDI